jgi:short subunit dehydrogenase-like uncharacterized protein
MSGLSVSLLIYGANGYSGELIARRAVERGLRPVLGGRRREAVAPLAVELGLESRAFSLDDPGAVDRGLAGATVVLSCAGPFSRTAGPMVQGCLRARAHYLDIAGEVAVFAALSELDAEARARGVMLLPGAGFDVVPSDCLAAHLHRRLPTATQLRLAFRPGGKTSRGTALSTLEAAGRSGMVRRNGVLTPVPLGHRTITVDFGQGAGPSKAIAIPWGDVFTAGATTGIPNVEVYIAVPWATRVMVHLTRRLGPLLASAPVQRFLAARIRSGPPGPSAEARRRGKSLLWGEARDDTGRVVTSRLVTAEGYELTRLTAVALAERALAGEARPGFQTPARAFGPDFALAFPGTTREDVS